MAGRGKGRKDKEQMIQIHFRIPKVLFEVMVKYSDIDKNKGKYCRNLLLDDFKIKALLKSKK